ncbi:unnamed protein product [Mytilus edulis]|uniref:Chitin-binding type-2 domain-containing protein n=1 Tax=Mytilus edulis TaxID=6550 RepID=A0A8S3PQ00_MYTED|nr:unnamed protein product [Mytilus edulis]
MVKFFSVFAGDCVGKGDGVFEIGCRSYLTCTGGVAKVTNCPNPPDPNTVYNNRTKTCDTPAHVGPPCGKLEDCTNKPDARYPDLFNTCHTYYTCQFGTYFGHNSCTPDVSFSADCIGLQDGNYQLNCQTYKACINGTAAVHNCPTPPALEIVFNNVTRKCDIPSNVALPCGGYHYDCSSKADGDYADLVTNYQVMSLLPCGGYHYDCSSKADGDYADLVTNCTSFAVCYGGN